MSGPGGGPGGGGGGGPSGPMPKPPPSALPKNAAELEMTLARMLDGQTVRAAEAILKSFMAKRDCVPAFMQQIVGSQRPELRQMAAVLLRDCIWRHWSKVAGDVQAKVKQALVQRLLAEPHRLVRLALCSLISSIARYLVPQHKWNELLGTRLLTPDATRHDRPHGR
jgi:hypothetical protein